MATKTPESLFCCGLRLPFNGFHFHTMFHPPTPIPTQLNHSMRERIICCLWHFPRSLTAENTFSAQVIFQLSPFFNRTGFLQTVKNLTKIKKRYIHLQLYKSNNIKRLMYSNNWSMNKCLKTNHIRLNWVAVLLNNLDSKVNIYRY